jgi:N6-adenosine-specific RNA methylase IME4
MTRPSELWGGLCPPYRTVVVDPPWQLGQVGVTKADSRKFYSTMTCDELADLPVVDLADTSAHLWLWAINSLVEEAYQLVRAWGFSPLTMVTWCKPGPGVGHYLRNNTEHCILASRGEPMTPVTKPLSTWFEWPRGAHSAKPAASFDLIEQVSPGPYVELFARAPRLGWDHWGFGYEVDVA